MRGACRGLGGGRVCSFTGRCPSARWPLESLPTLEPVPPRKVRFGDVLRDHVGDRLWSVDVRRRASQPCIVCVARMKTSLEERLYSFPQLIIFSFYGGEVGGRLEAWGGFGP